MVNQFDHSIGDIMERIQANLPRILMGGMALAFTLLFGVILEPGSSFFIAFIIFNGLSGGLALPLWFGQEIRFLRGTAVPYLAKLAFCSSLAVLSLGDVLKETKNPETWWRIYTSGGLFIACVVAIVLVTARTKQLARRK